MAWYKPWTWGDESESATQQRNDLNTQGGRASDFAGFGEADFQGLGAEAAGVRDMLRDQATGKSSLSAEQLRQGLQQQVAAQRSMAAGAPAGSGPMAARTAMLGAGRASSAMAGNAAMAGIAERQAAQRALMDAILQQRQQGLQAALGSRQTAIGAYGAVQPDKSFLDKWGNAILGGAGLASGGGGRR